MSLAHSRVRLEDRRFATRFLGRPGTWLWLAVTLLPGIAAWIWAGVALRGFAGDERTWFLWSGNVVLVLFVLTLGFVFRKWAVKVPSFRNRGRAPLEAVDASWAAIQELNRSIAKGTFTGDVEILAAADGILRRFQVEKIERAEVAVIRVRDRDVKFVRVAKREPFIRLEPWLEMHMGIGTAACVGVWFHADGIIRHPIGWILFVASMVVLATGVLGAILYRTLPSKLAREGGEIPYEEIGVARENYEASLAGAAKTLDPALQTELQSAFRTSSSFEDLHRSCESILGSAAAKAPDHIEVVRDLLVLAGTRDYMLWTTAKARAIDLQLKLWRWIHVPVSVFLFFMIALHVWVVLWY